MVYELEVDIMGQDPPGKKSCTMNEPDICIATTIKEAKLCFSMLAPNECGATHCIRGLFGLRFVDLRAFKIHYMMPLLGEKFDLTTLYHNMVELRKTIRLNRH